jgi:hypothetical protein
MLEKLNPVEDVYLNQHNGMESVKLKSNSRQTMYLSYFSMIPQPMTHFMPIITNNTSTSCSVSPTRYNDASKLTAPHIELTNYQFSMLTSAFLVLSPFGRHKSGTTSSMYILQSGQSTGINTTT